MADWASTNESRQKAREEWIRDAALKLAIAAVRSSKPFIASGLAHEARSIYEAAEKAAQKP